MLKIYFHESFTNDFALAKAKLQSVLDYLKNGVHGLTEEDLLDLRLIYNELILNGIVHGNKQDASKKVYLFIETDGKRIISTIRDEGEGFDYSRLADVSAHELLSESGRGLQLVTSLVDFFEWNTLGNEIKFHKKVIKKNRFKAVSHL